jgi:hypothetical protein
MDRDAEIAEIRRELDILRTRYALYAEWGRILKIFFTIGVPLMAVGGAVTAIAIFGTDALLAAFFVFMIAVMAAVIWLIMNLGVGGRAPGWIDLASPPARFTITSPSDARVIETQIAARERRLAELGAH